MCIVEYRLLIEEQFISNNRMEERESEKCAVSVSDGKIVPYFFFNLNFS